MTVCMWSLHDKWYILLELENCVAFEADTDMSKSLDAADLPPGTGYSMAQRPPLPTVLTLHSLSLHQSQASQPAVRTSPSFFLPTLPCSISPYRIPVPPMFHASQAGSKLTLLMYPCPAAPVTGGRSALLIPVHLHTRPACWPACQAHL